ncbi:hypothetical protein N0V90_007859 [Kalmusia sp. IMI 367209]|nr:hypothetical protein N0V90_007859 [Kalmusia sp. IMI 367209]
MSGLEIAGVLLGAFPLIISALEHWRDVAEVGRFLRRTRKEYSACRREVQFHEIVYKRNLKGLLLPIIKDADEVARLIDDPGNEDWRNKALQQRLEEQLQESYNLYMEIISEMNETAEELRKELALDKESFQSKLASPEAEKQRRLTSLQPLIKSSKLASVKAIWDYETFRLKFSFSEPVRSKLFKRLEKYNGQLEKLLSTSNKILGWERIAPPNTKHTSSLEKTFRKVWKKSDLLFKAIHKSWKCSCRQYHFANLRLEHRTLAEVYFEMILMSLAPSSQSDTLWSWREVQCGQMIGCSIPQELMKPPTTPQSLQHRHDQSFISERSSESARRRKVAFVTSSTSIPKMESDIIANPTINLCQFLRNEEHGKCIGIISHDDEIYHLHPAPKRKRPDHGGPVTLDHILSGEFGGEFTRGQRFSIALLLASSVAQLRYTPWLNNGLAKKDVLFFPCVNDDCSMPYHEPFICQGFTLNDSTTSGVKANEFDLSSLGILLVELCFGSRLEEQPIRQRYPTEFGEAKQAYDLVAALKWSEKVLGDGGKDYASAVRWCFFPSVTTGDPSWRGEMIKNVIEPLERCKEHLTTLAVL